jgi:predicted phosphodiesterase
MRAALISDIHANFLALKTVLAAIEEDNVDQTICLGDVANLGPQPKETLGLIRERGIPCIIGNHDAFILDSGLVHTYTDQPVIIQAVDWSREQLDQDDLDFLRTFKPTLRLAMDDGMEMLLFHGSPASNMEDILATTPPEDIDRMLSGQNAAVAVCGHTHIQMLRQHKGTLLVNPGSVGCPFLEYMAGAPPIVMPYAEYAVVECARGALEVSLRRLYLDKKDLYQTVEQSDFPLREMMLLQYSA